MLTHQVGRFVDPTRRTHNPTEGLFSWVTIAIAIKSVTRSKVVGGKFKCFCNIVLSCSVQIVCLLFWQEEERGGHLLCWFVMSLQKNYFVVSVYPRTVCKCQEGTQGCPIYEPAASHHTHPQRTQWAKIYEKIREIATLVCNFMNAIIVDHISKNL